jgi:hypothetical protein
MPFGASDHRLLRAALDFIERTDLCSRPQAREQIRLMAMNMGLQCYWTYQTVARSDRPAEPPEGAGPAPEDWKDAVFADDDRVSFHGTRARHIFVRWSQFMRLRETLQQSPSPALQVDTDDNAGATPQSASHDEPAMHANRRGPTPDFRLRIESQMIEDIRSGAMTIDALMRMKQVSLAAQYGAKSRDTVVRARNNVLQQLRQNSDKTPTSDK